MTPEIWRQVEELYHAASARGPEERAAMLARVDPEIRREAESLLAQDSSREGLLDRPAAELLADSNAAELVAGEMLGPYRIEAPIGAGGMGDVYRAHDTRLGRDVAIKVAASQFSGRFEHEARAVAALNHPHICTLYDIGPNYLVMELIDGETLSTRLKRGKLSLEETRRYGAQVADALAAAHAKGIVHRDLKPANIMLTGNGAKVLDFGLAKSAQAATVTASKAVMGTPVYMAPEQTAGEEVDSRADLFALGLVLYEMRAGCLPFPGASLGSMLTKAANVTVNPPSMLSAELTRELDPLILRLLAKDPAQRVQSAVQVRDRLLAPATPKRTPGWWIAAGLAVLIAIGFGILREAIRRGRTDVAPLKYTRLTDFPDSVHSPALSKDGRMLTFVRGPVTFSGGPGEVYLKILPDGPPVALTNDSSLTKMSPVFSPDGSHVVFTASSRAWSSFSIPVSGGQPTMWMPNASGLHWTGPAQILFSEIKTGHHMGLVAATESRASPREVYFPKSPEGMVHFSEQSPDGKSVLAVEMVNAVWQPCRLLPFDGSTEGKPVGPAGALCMAATWSPDSRWMYFAAELDGVSHLWRQRFPGGTPEQLTAGPNEEWGVAVNPSGQSLITSVGTRQSSVWIHDDNGDRPVSVEGYAYRPLFSSRGDRVFYLVRRAIRGTLRSGELWSFDLASSRNERVLPDFLVQNYHVSQDGMSVVFDSLNKSGRSAIWIAPLDRSQPPRRMTSDSDADELRPFLSESGDILFMRRLPNDDTFLYRMKKDGSERTQLAAGIGYLVNVSINGKWAVFWNNHPGDSTQLFSLTGGGYRTLCGGCSMGPIFQDPPRASWSADGALLFVNPGGSVQGSGTIVIPWHNGGGGPRTESTRQIYVNCPVPD